jgi:hypothetical protein
MLRFFAVPVRDVDDGSWHDSKLHRRPSKPAKLALSRQVVSPRPLRRVHPSALFAASFCSPLTHWHQGHDLQLLIPGKLDKPLALLRKSGAAGKD